MIIEFVFIDLNRLKTTFKNCSMDLKQLSYINDKLKSLTNFKFE